MATIVNTPATTDTGTNTGLVVGIILIALLIFALLFYGGRNFLGGFVGRAPADQPNSSQPGQTNNNYAPDVNVPKDVNINVNPGY